MTEQCDKCKDDARTYGPGYKLCPKHSEQKDRREFKIGQRRTKREGIIEQTCPRYYEMFQGFRDGNHQWRYRNTDDWRTCSYCGSVHPDFFMEKVRAGEPIGPTDKSYKAYLKVNGHAKFYYQHLGEEAQIEFVKLWNDGTLKTKKYDFDKPEITSEIVEAKTYWDGALPFFMKRK
jgi:hypothetical protein